MHEPGVQIEKELNITPRAFGTQLPTKIAPTMHPGACRGMPGSIVRGSGSLPGCMLAALECLLAGLGCFLAASWPLLGRSWAAFGVSWKPPGCILALEDAGDLDLAINFWRVLGLSGKGWRASHGVFFKADCTPPCPDSAPASPDFLPSLGSLSCPLLKLLCHYSCCMFASVFSTRTES